MLRIIAVWYRVVFGEIDLSSQVTFPIFPQKHSTQAIKRKRSLDNSLCGMKMLTFLCSKGVKKPSC